MDSAAVIVVASASSSPMTHARHTFSMCAAAAAFTRVPTSFLVWGGVVLPW
jgi:hypothetical protein